MKYRILLATSGWYYVQRNKGLFDWKKIGGFFETKQKAREFIDDLRVTDRCRSYDKIVEYY